VREGVLFERFPGPELEIRMRIGSRRRFSVSNHESLRTAGHFVPHIVGKAPPGTCRSSTSAPQLAGIEA
jgi:hypothetical protein